MGGFGIEFGRAMVERLTRAIHPRVFVVHVVKAIHWLNVDDGQHLISENTDREFFAFDEFFDQGLSAVFFSQFDGLVPFFFGTADVDADAGSFTRGFGDKRDGNR